MAVPFGIPIWAVDQVRNGKVGPAASRLKPDADRNTNRWCASSSGSLNFLHAALGALCNRHGRVRPQFNSMLSVLKKLCAQSMRFPGRRCDLRSAKSEPCALERGAFGASRLTTIQHDEFQFAPRRPSCAQTSVQQAGQEDDCS